jgi:phosphopantothenoylcysteine decarboxylase/phosphopantothenate--cysteine ligase
MKILVTAGPTYEPLDPVRFIGNYSTGKMGIAIADEFAQRGNEVVLVKGPTPLHASHASVKEVKVQTAAQMFKACAQYFMQSDVIVFAAAVADYTPVLTSTLKIKKKEETFCLEMTKTKDIAAELGKQKTPQQIVVGFALETDNELQNAIEKLHKKNMDFIVLNSMQHKGAGFGHDTNMVTFIDKNGNVTKFDLKPKAEVAKDIADYTYKMIAERK